MLKIKRCLILAAVVALSAPLLADEIDDMNAQVGELSRLGKYADASSLAQTSAEMARVKFGEASTQYARAVSWQAYLLQLRGRYEQAEPMFEKALEIYSSILPPGSPEIATSINNLGFNYQNSDRLIDAERMYKQALDMREKAQPRSEAVIADSLNNLAQCYKRQYRVSEAIPLLVRSLAMRAKVLPPNDPLMAQSLGNLGSAYELDGEFKKAEPYYREALKIRRASQPADHPDIAGAINKLAEVLYKQGRYAEAEPLFRDAIEIRYKTQSAGHIDVAIGLHASALNLIEMKKTGEAKAALRAAIAIEQMTLPPLHPSIANSQAALARVIAAEGDPAQALTLIRVAAVSQVARGRHDDLAKQHYSNFVDLAWEVYRRDTSRSNESLNNQALEMSQRAALTETATTVTKMAARFSALDPVLRDVIREREELDADLAKLETELSAILSIPVDERAKSADTTRAQLDDVVKKIAAIDADLQVRFPKYANLVSPNPLSIEETRALLGADEALVYYHTRSDGVYLWAVTREGQVWQRLEPDTATLASNINALRDTLDVGTIVEQGTSAKLFELGRAHQLYKWLLAPVDSLVGKKAKLIIVPSGPLTTLPFQMLVKNAPAIGKPSLLQLASYRDADWLMNHHALSVMPAISSLRAMRQTAARPESERAMIGFGNPVFDPRSQEKVATPPVYSVPRQNPGVQSTRLREESSLQTGASLVRATNYRSFWRGPAANLDALRSGLQPLPETETELRFVADKLRAKAADLVLGAAATETAVKSTDLSRYRIVYFATHGLVAGEVGGLAEPALAFSVPPTATDLDDGLLTASEVSQLKLNADWVILSACNTASGDANGAEALSGLAKSFFHAGARALLVSHWRVGSQATARLTTSTFEIMAKEPSLGRAEALRRSMRAFVADTSDPWSGYPTFWAPFIVVGEGGI